MDHDQNAEDRKKNKSDKVKEQQVTYEMYAEMPDDGQRHEIFDGTLELMSPGPSTSHQAINRDLEFILMQCCRNEYYIFDAPYDVILSETNVVQPDIMMVHRDRKHIIEERGIVGPPDLVVEILSPGSRKRDKVIKLELYARHGVLEYWIVDAPSRTLEQFQLVDDGRRYELVNLFEAGDVVTSDRLPCVSFVVSDLFLEILS